MARNRTAFTDEQRAEIYRLDRATCSFSGRNLWILDYGMDPSYAIDWADHITPASKGGLSEIENGTTTCWFLNRHHGNSNRRRFLFFRGKPTSNFYWFDGAVPESTFRNLKRFAKLRHSDWYLNRGLWLVWAACQAEYEASCGYNRSRKKEYYCSAALKMFTKWRRSAGKEAGNTIEKRGLMPKVLAADQEQLLLASTVGTERELLKLTRGLLMPYRHTATLLDLVSTADSFSEVDKARKYEAKQSDIPKRISERAIKMMNQIEQALELAD